MFAGIDLGILALTVLAEIILYSVLQLRIAPSDTFAKYWDNTKLTKYNKGTDLTNLKGYAYTLKGKARVA
jgi:hypothetical protein